MPELPTAWAAPGAPAPAAETHTTATRTTTTAVRGVQPSAERIARPVPLRPLSVLELIDAAIGAVRTVPAALLGWASVLVFGTALVDFALNWLFDTAVATATRAHPVIDTDELGNTFVQFGKTNGAGTFGVVAVRILLPLVCSGFAVTVVAGLLADPIRRYVDGTSAASPAASAASNTAPGIRQPLGRLFAVATVTALPRVIVLGLYAVVTLLIVNDPQGGYGGLLALTTVAGVPLCCWATAEWAVAAPVAALENARRLSALRRAHALITAGRWRTLWGTALTLLLAVVATAPLTICQYYIGSAHGVGDLMNGLPVGGAVYWWLAGYALLVALAQMLTVPFRAGVAAMLYVDRRFRREGLDIRIAWARVARNLTADRGR